MKLTYSHLLAVYFAAIDAELVNGSRWYADALEVCSNIATDCSLAIDTVAGVMAALSPNNRWERNITDCRNLCLAYCLGGYADAEQIKVTTFNANKRKALNILSGQLPLSVLSGLKVRAFFECIVGADSVCIDGHAYSIWQGERITTTSTPKISPKLYAAISADYRHAAGIINQITGLSYSAAQLQAITWLTWRRLVARGDNQ